MQNLIIPFMDYIVTIPIPVASIGEWRSINNDYSICKIAWCDGTTFLVGQTGLEFRNPSFGMK